MNRIGIFCFYDKNGIVDRYIEYLLEELCQCLSSLVIVVNGKIDVKGKIILEKYADEVYIRENKGFDGGAYKDVLMNFLGWNKIHEYDELIFCNDTFYGPFIPFKSIFDEMKGKNVDFWGLNYYYNKITNHLQSYFLVFRKRIIDGNCIMNYFDKNINLSMSDITDIYGDFEVGLFSYLFNQGYSFASYSKNNPFDIYKSSNYCIKQFNVPILKKKAFSPQYIVRDNIMDTLKYLSLNTTYDLNLILSNIRRIYDLKISKENIETFDIDTADIQENKYDVAKIRDEDIKKLVFKKKRIYIYGLGIFAGRINSIINIFQGRIEGYIVSDNQYSMPNYKKGIRVYRVSEIINTENMVVIVALNKEHTQEVASNLKKFKDVIYLW